MNKKQIQAEVARRIDAGESKTAIHRSLLGGELNEGRLAHLIATHAEERLTHAHARLVTALVVIAWVQLVFALVMVLAVGLQSGMAWGPILLLAAFTAGFGYLFIWGYRHHKAWAYTLSIFLSIINLPKAFKDFSAEPVTSLVAFAVSVAVIAFTWHVRSKLFPDLHVVGPRKVKGSFVFSS